MGWWRERMVELSMLGGYTKPERPESKNMLRMDTNENLALPLDLIKEVMREALDVDPRLYPEQYDELKVMISRYANVSKDSIVIGNGSDQLIDLALSVFCKGRRGVTIRPTFTFYRDRCMLHGIGLDEVMLDDEFTFSSGSINGSGADVCYICSPNNPTGNQFSRDLMMEVIEGFDGLIMVDEAYAEFAGYSLKDEAVKRDNLILFRTFSKAFGLAGARVGYAIASREMVDVFNRVVQYPYPVSSISLRAAMAMLRRVERVRSVIDGLKVERRWLYEQMSSIGIKAFRSDANFILFDARRDDVHARLKEDGVLVRRIGQVGRYSTCLRVTVGSREMNEGFIDSLKRATSA
ncbi:MAG: histidinol-phosphate aminotransferase family protein [Candidatus Nitrosocaldus sp.]|nr:histidinol-phosphate aminotransferase family protein [Candidatus Nitrosocaldus sp.]MDW8000291.1 histidinol-phosphate transaminase [Candidatus Nitrosocaldus sp.]